MMQLRSLEAALTAKRDLNISRADIEAEGGRTHKELQT